MSKAKAPARKPPTRKLKVFVTAIGFHDAYVAAPSRKAALAAWGSTHDLFARGVASEVHDDDRAAEPLAHPGEVIKRIRGTREEQLAALGEASPPGAGRPRQTVAGRVAREAAPPPPRPTPPSEAAAKAAAAALRDARAEGQRALDAVRRERDEIDRRERALRRRLDDDERRLREELEQAEADLADRKRRYERDLAAFQAATR